ncbi:MAG: peroxiredoxin family protein [bacterium]
MKLIKNSFFLILLIIISATGVVLLATQNHQLSALLEYEKNPAIGDPAFLFQAKDISSNIVDIRSAYAILVFFTTKCETCIKAMPLWQQFYSELDTTKFLFVGISANPELKVRAFAEEHGLTFPIVVDEKYDILWAYHVKHFPLTIIVQPDGRMAYYQEPQMTAKQVLAETEDFIRNLK